MEDQKIKPVKETITIRDQFAMAALTGYLAGEYATPDDAAEMSYKYADAMLKARNL